MINYYLQFFGGRGASSSGAGGGGDINTSNRIKNQIIQKGLNSKFAGVRRDAENGKGRFSFKDAEAVNSKTALKMNVFRSYEENGNTLYEGEYNGKSVFYANSNSDSTIKALNAREEKRKKNIAEESKARDVNITPTATYDRWKKRNDANFAAWFGKDRLK